MPIKTRKMTFVRIFIIQKAKNVIFLTEEWKKSPNSDPKLIKNGERSIRNKQEIRNFGA